MSSSDVRGPDAAKSPDTERLSADARAAAFGRIMALLMASPRHASMTLSEAQAFVTPAIAHGQLAILGKQSAVAGGPDVAAAVWWAMVSPEVDERLTQSREPYLILTDSDWRSGDQPWIIETIGNGEVINELVRHVVERTLSGKPAKLRAHLPDGRIAVGRIERKPADGQQTNT